MVPPGWNPSHRRAPNRQTHTQAPKFQVDLAGDQLGGLRRVQPH